MKEITRAEIMLKQFVKQNRLIKRMESTKETIIPQVEVPLSNDVKNKIKALQSEIQKNIDKMIEEREMISNLVEQIQDGEVKLVLELRYGTLEKRTDKMPWLEVLYFVNYELESVRKRHKKGIEVLNKLLEHSEKTAADGKAVNGGAN